MALIYNIKEDIRYQEGEEKGEIKKTTKTVLNMLRLNFSIEQIMEVAEVSKEFVEKIKAQTKK